jgi:hypothetical protein
MVQGEIIFFQVTPVTYSGGGEGNLHELEIKINLKFVDNLHRRILYEKQSITFTDTYRIDSGDAPGFQNAALKRIGRKFASEIVTSVLTGIQ